MDAKNLVLTGLVIVLLATLAIPLPAVTPITGGVHAIMAENSAIDSNGPALPGIRPNGDCEVPGSSGCPTPR